MLALIIGIFILIITPAIYDGLSITPRLKIWADICISGLMIYVLAGHVAPEVHQQIGSLGYLIGLLGFFGMTVLERACHGKFENVHRTALILVFLGFTVHVALDGVALSSHHNGHAHAGGATLSSLSLAILLHRLPVALLVWAKLYPLLGRAKAFSILVLMAVVSVIGFVLGDFFFAGSNQHYGLAYLEAFIAGCLLHVLIHQLSILKIFILRAVIPLFKKRKV